MSHFKTGKRGIVARFSAEERLFLGDVLPLLDTVGSIETDPAAARLNVPVYLDDPVANDEWWRLMGSELDRGREVDRGVFQRLVRSRGSLTLTDGEADSLVRVLNEARLTLGARIGIEVEADHDRLSPEETGALDFLGWVQEELTMELTRNL
jgi:hypothetical protein